MFHRPVRKQEGTDVGHRRGGGPQLCQSHDVFKGDVSLGAHVHHVDLLRRAVRAAARGPPDDLHHDGVLASMKGLRCLFMAWLWQLLPVHLRAKRRKPVLLSVPWRHRLPLVTVEIISATVAIAQRWSYKRPLCFEPKICFSQKESKLELNSFKKIQ